MLLILNHTNAHVVCKDVFIKWEVASIRFILTENMNFLYVFCVIKQRPFMEFGLCIYYLNLISIFCMKLRIWYYWNSLGWHSSGCRYFTLSCVVKDIITLIIKCGFTAEMHANSCNLYQVMSVYAGIHLFCLFSC